MVLPAVSATGSELGRRGPGDVIEVFPGRHAIQKALAIAHPGDVLNIHTGRYPESFQVTTPDLVLQDAGDGRVAIDGRCLTNTTVEVAADDVTLDGLMVKGAAEGFGFFPANVEFEGVASGIIKHTRIVNSCDAEYGVSVYASGAVLVQGNVASGFTDSSIYIGAITDTDGGALVVSGNRAFGSSRGIIVEDSTGGVVQVVANSIHENISSGILVTNSDGVLIKGNTISNDGYSGIELDPFSDLNRIVANTVSGHTYDLANDGGSGNCFKRNTYSTSYGTIGC
jgi:parallel beta-helix repeat protein